MDTILKIFVLFCCWYLIIGASLSLLPRYETWLGSQVENLLHLDPTLDEYVVRVVAYGVFIFFWAFFWVDPLRPKKKK